MEKAQDNRQVATEALGEHDGFPPPAVLCPPLLLCCAQYICLINKSLQLVVQLAL